LFIKPVINLFSNEFEGSSYRKCITEKALDHKKYKGKIYDVIIDSLEYYKKINPESIEARNGVKILRPASFYQNLHTF
jgi:hypothetical protein